MNLYGRNLPIVPSELLPRFDGLVLCRKLFVVVDLENFDVVVELIHMDRRMLNHSRSLRREKNLF